MAGDDRPLDLRDHRRVEAVHAGPRIASGGQGREQVLAQLLPEGAAGVSGGAQLAESLDVRLIAHTAHRSPAMPLPLPA